MLLFCDGQQLGGDNEVCVPQFMSAALGFHTGLELTIAATSGVSDNSLQNELVLTSQPIARWMNSWRLRATFADRQGIIRELTSCLEEFNIDVVSSHVTTFHQHDFLHVDMWLDVNSLDAKPGVQMILGMPTTRPGIDQVKMHIAALFWRELLFPQGDKPYLSITQNIPLHFAHARLLERDTLRIDTGRFRMPEKMLDHIRKRFVSAYASESRPPTDFGSPVLYLVADTANSALRLVVTFKDTGHVHFRVKAQDKIGNLAKISTRLMEGHFNILQMYSRPYGETGTACTDVLAHLRAEYDTERHDDTLRGFVTNLLRQGHTEELDCEIEFPDVNRNGTTTVKKSWWRRS